MIFFRIVLIGLTLAYALNAPCQNSFSENDKHFAQKYDRLIPEDEKIEASWFHYVKTKNKDGKYLVRTIFPETKMVTSLIEYKDKKCRNKNGKALYWKDDGSLYKEGMYKDDEEEGKWKYYAPRGTFLLNEGSYIKGKREGLWLTYDSKGRTREEYFYIDNKREGRFVMYDTLGKVNNEGTYSSDTLFHQSNENKQVIVQPEFKGCETMHIDNERKKCVERMLLNFLYSKIEYPLDAREYGVEGKVFAFFDINKEGKVINLTIPNGLCQSIKKEVLTIMQSMPDWTPGMLDGKVVNVSFTLPILFKLE